MNSSTSNVRSNNLTRCCGFWVAEKHLSIYFRRIPISSANASSFNYCFQCFSKQFLILPFRDASLKPHQFLYSRFFGLSGNLPPLVVGRSAFFSAITKNSEFVKLYQLDKVK